MAETNKTIKTRIKSVKNTKKITKAMELVSAAKMRRVVGRSVSIKPYIDESLAIIRSIKTTSIEHPLLVSHTDNNKTLVIVISSDKGLCGAYNAQILRAVAAYTTSTQDQCDIVSIGKKGMMALKSNPCPVVASFEQKECAHAVESHVVSKYAIEAFIKGKYERVMVAHTEYLSALNQIPHVTQLLPFSDSISEEKESDYVFEPGADAILNIVIEKIIHTRLYGMITESVASEESSRMIAMKNASDAAGEMISDLSLMYNKIRQAGITQEISEISAGMASTH